VVTNLLVRSLNDTLYRLTLTGPFEDHLISCIRVTVALNQLLALSESIAPATWSVCLLSMIYRGVYPKYMKLAGLQI
jgi:hypothetical protein